MVSHVLCMVHMLSRILLGICAKLQTLKHSCWSFASFYYWSQAENDSSRQSTSCNLSLIHTFLCYMFLFKCFLLTRTQASSWNYVFVVKTKNILKISDLFLCSFSSFICNTLAVMLMLVHMSWYNMKLL